jgi:indole-3-glycerol phosphate synthase
MALIDDILRASRHRLAERKRRVSLAELQTKASQAPRGDVGFRQALDSRAFSLIAEIKNRSPSSGEMASSNLAEALSVYDGTTSVSAISILTDEDHFGNSIDDLRRAREATRKPILRKDFIYDEYQVWEARANGADAVLVMAGLHDDDPPRASRLIELARLLGMDVLFELGMQGTETGELPRGATVCGINARRFDTSRLQVRARVGRFVGAELSIDSDKHRLLRSCIPEDRIAVAESGIDEPSRLGELRALKYRAALVGTAFLKKGVRLRDVVRSFHEAIDAPSGDRAMRSSLGPS